MANQHLKLDPHNITERCWWYEQDEGINIVVEHTTSDGNRWLHTEQYLIPWNEVRAALSRKELSA
jgi:hypothetical protein